MAHGTTRVTPAQGRSDRSIESILIAADRLMAKAGGLHFTAHDLAVEAGMSIGRVYYWFKDLNDIRCAVAGRIAAALTAATPMTANEFLLGVYGRWLSLPVLTLCGTRDDVAHQVVLTAMVDQFGDRNALQLAGLMLGLPTLGFDRLVTAVHQLLGQAINAEQHAALLVDRYTDAVEGS